MRLALLWHMHQPDYRLPDGSAATMPWVRLHAAKDYVDVPRLAVECGVPITLNVVPVLLDQLQNAAAGLKDPLLERCHRDPGTWSVDERLEHLERSFQLPAETMIDPLPGYGALRRRWSRVAGDPAAALEAFSDADLIDLSMLYHLAWCGPALRREPWIHKRIVGGPPHSMADLLTLLERMQRWSGEVLTQWSQWAKSGAVEISTTPYFHPILPLLHDERAAALARPGTRPPPRPFRWPLDAGLQLSRAIERVEAALGVRPRGIWPSEGALSEPVLDQLAQLGVRWTATDVHLLGKSVPAAGPVAHLQPWTWGDRLRVFFRDTAMSDAVGFRYSKLSPEAAVADFLERARALARRWEGADEPCVAVVLDGENAWEHFPDQGEPFLRAFYEAIADAPDIDAVTLSDAATSCVAAPLPRLLPGSWIRGDLDTWAGHPEKNRAWGLLAEARDEWERWAPTATVDALEAAREHLFAAEGSDWFWWLGDDHPTPWQSAFDECFRGHLRALWSAFGVVPPPHLDEAIPAPSPGGATFLAPTGPVTGAGDGTDLPWSAWSEAGTYVPGRHGGAMRSGERPLVARLRFGFDATHLHILAEPEAGALIDRLDPEFPPSASGLPSPDRHHLAWGWEARFPRSALGPPGTELHVIVVVGDEVLPPHGSLRLVVPGDELFRRHWSA